MNICPACHNPVPANYTPEMKCLLCIRYGPPEIRSFAYLTRPGPVQNKA